MANGDKDQATRVAERLAEYIKGQVELVKSRLAPGIGMEEITREEFRRRFNQGGPEQRQQLMEAVGGPDGAMEILQGEDSG